MIAKLSSPLGSPTLAATTAQLRNRLPAQFRRCVPLYIGAVVLVLFIFNLNLFHLTGHRVPPHPQYATKISPPKVVRSGFPNKIWQTWKVSPLAFEQRDLDVARSWTRKNPDWRYEVLTDGNDMRYVEWHFGPEGFDRPDIVNFYRDVKAAIVKADLLRYLIMYAEGGLYADIDVEALRPLTKFIPDRYDVKDIDMIIGVEIDEPDWKDHPILGPKSRSFCQWTFMCKPQLPVMMRLIEQIMTWLNGVAKEQGVSLSEVKLDFDQIISGTGPSAFTNAILTEMDLAKEDPNQKIDWDLFHDMSESRIVSRVLVLTVEAFAAGQGHSDSGNHDARAALVRHHYHASNWPSRHPRYSHPAYGEVEKCNWNDDCVHKWDRDVAAFEKMSEEEQKRIIEEKEREKKEEEDKKKREKEAAEKKKKEEAEAARKKKEEEDRAAHEAKVKQGPETADGVKPGMVVPPPGDKKAT
ncbi:hypothetical protein QBC34DRAFT_66342 [Podospora aff. communis PSN243]|uniref:Glycosyltransferase Family 32 n=1 Tax=Podospora aff. communis PSN243 TaxID=3040156 RepID=A0AAV9GW98_9PEZI|nr:hypothetical protein QBC34DRAFT_66342 [Podospora aff. communis PSN243]